MKAKSKFVCAITRRVERRCPTSEAKSWNFYFVKFFWILVGKTGREEEKILDIHDPLAGSTGFAPDPVMDFAPSSCHQCIC
jgi:hypothetical protein